MDRFETKYENCAKKMRAALLSLMKDYPFDRISISQLCTKAGVNRSTFYAHYDDLDSLLADTEQKNIFEPITQALGNKPMFDGNWFNHDVLLGFVTFLYDHQDILLAYRHQSDSIWFRQVKAFFDRYVSPLSQQQVAAFSRKADYVYTFYLAGVTKIICHWADRDFQETPEEITQILMACHACTADQFIGSF